MGRYRAGGLEESRRPWRDHHVRPRLGIHEQQSILGIQIEPEKEVVLTLTYEDKSEAILREIVEAAELEEPGHGLVFVVPVSKVAGVPHLSPASL